MKFWEILCHLEAVSENFPLKLLTCSGEYKKIYADTVTAWDFSKKTKYVYKGK